MVAKSIKAMREEEERKKRMQTYQLMLQAMESIMGRLDAIEAKLGIQETQPETEDKPKAKRGNR